MELTGRDPIHAVRTDPWFGERFARLFLNDERDMPFVGLIVPHALRLKLGADHRVLIPCSFLLGAAFLAVCDTVSRTILSPVEVPVGVITALLGGPFFIWLLRGKRRSLWL